MIDKKTVFVLGAEASCPYGYPSGALLRKRVCLSQGLWQDYSAYNLPDFSGAEKELKLKQIGEFKNAFNKSQIKSIDLFIANNSEFAPIGKYIIAFEILRAERQSLFGEEAKFEQEQIAYLQSHGKRGPLDLFPRPLFLGEDWYFYLYNRLIEELVGKNTLPDFSNGNLAFITFNYDRSLEQFFYEALRNSFTEVSEDDIVKFLKKLKILHVYGQIASLKWQNTSAYVNYKPPLSEYLLQLAVNNIRTIYEEKESPELEEAQKLLVQAEEIFFLGFGYAPENMEVLGLPRVISRNRSVFGTALGLRDNEANRIRKRIESGVNNNVPGYMGPLQIKIDNNADCLMLLKDYLS